MKVIGDYLLDKECIGKGQFGEVYKCYLREDHKKTFACKVINRKKLNERLFNNLRNEINILMKIKSPYVIDLKDLQKTPNNFYLVMEYCNGGDLDNLRDIRGRFKEEEARIILQQIVYGFKEIYKQKVMHRDLKLANILINFPNEDLSFKHIKNPIEKTQAWGRRLKELDLLSSNMQIKIGDLGFARELQHDELTNTIVGTPLVMAP